MRANCFVEYAIYMIVDFIVSDHYNFFIQFIRFMNFLGDERGGDHFEIFGIRIVKMMLI
jgi:hypothetical protein